VSAALLSLYSGECHSFSQSPPSPPLLTALLARFGVRCLWVWSAHLLPSPPSPPLSAVLPARFGVQRLGVFFLVCDARVWYATASSFPVPSPGKFPSFSLSCFSHLLQVVSSLCLTPHMCPSRPLFRRRVQSSDRSVCTPSCIYSTAFTFPSNPVRGCHNVQNRSGNSTTVSEVNVPTPSFPPEAPTLRKPPQEL